MKQNLSIFHLVVMLMASVALLTAVLPRGGEETRDAMDVAAPALAESAAAAGEIFVLEAPSEMPGLPMVPDLPLAPMCAALLLPVVPGVRRRGKRAKIRTRFGGPLTARANEDTPDTGVDGGDAPSLAGDFQVLDAAGKPIGMASAATGAGGQPFAAMRANAVTAQAAAISPLLTGYANGYPADNVNQVVEFFSPTVPTPVIFQYRNPALANALGMEPKDQIGATGVPQTVHPDAASLTSGQLMFRGLETPFTEQDLRLAEGMLGNTADRERQRRVRFLVGTLRRGRAYRTYQLVQSTAGAATGLTIYTDQDPYKALRSYLEAVILEAGSPEYVRVCLGYQTLNGFKDHPLINGVGAGRHHDVTEAEIASKLGIPAKNLLVSWHQVCETKQGKTASKTVLIGATQMYIFVCRPTPDEEDNSWLKTFTLTGQADGDGLFSVYTHDPHPMYEQIGCSYWEKMVNTNTAANATKRLAVTFSASASS